MRKSVTNKLIIFALFINLYVILYKFVGIFANKLIPITPLGSMISLALLFLLIPVSYLSAHGVVKIIKDM